MGRGRPPCFGTNARHLPAGRGSTTAVTRRLGVRDLFRAAWRGIVGAPWVGGRRPAPVGLGDASAGIASGWLALAGRFAACVPSWYGRGARGLLGRGGV